VRYVLHAWLGHIPCLDSAPPPERQSTLSWHFTGCSLECSDLHGHQRNTVPNRAHTGDSPFIDKSSCSAALWACGQTLGAFYLWCVWCSQLMLLAELQRGFVSLLASAAAVLFLYRSLPCWPANTHRLVEVILHLLHHPLSQVCSSCGIVCVHTDARMKML